MILEELITRERVQVLDRAEDWQEAIRLASKPLLEEKVIGVKYVDAMIDAVKEYGPYIVLADEFALPHAGDRDSVRELGMSLLILKQAVDMLGKPVKILLVLAAVDSDSHLEALSSLTEILSEEENLETFKKGNVDEIMEIIKGGVR